MWLKFDGQSSTIRWGHDTGDIKEKSFTFVGWVHIVEHNGRLYIDGKEQ